ncbi:MAG: nucleotidyltransferase substrate binding protein [Bacteroidia bacterium]|nr:nucleotidyltransferase substrate binding protein [Bacteroidia bacterium]
MSDRLDRRILSTLPGEAYLIEMRTDNKDYLEFAGYAFPLGSPRQVLITAGQAGLLQDVEAWLQLLALRNRLSHLYEKALLEEAVEMIQQKVLPLFRQLQRQLAHEAPGSPSGGASANFCPAS